jgi:hypothetical protein
MAFTDWIDGQRFADLAGGLLHADCLSTRGRFAYCRTHLVPRFAQALAVGPPTILITAGSDALADDALAGQVPPNVVRWYSTNATAADARLQGIPIGFPANPRKLAAAAALAIPRTEKALLYVCHTENDLPCYVPRRGLRDRFAREAGGAGGWATVEGGADCSAVPPERFYAGLRSHPFTLAPPGAGPDTHRVWEALCLGCVPIILRGDWWRWFAELPALVVDSWDEVTPERLNAERGLCARAQDPHPLLTFDYWRRSIERH